MFQFDNEYLPIGEILAIGLLELLLYIPLFLWLRSKSERPVTSSTARTTSLLICVWALLNTLLNYFFLTNARLGTVTLAMSVLCIIYATRRQASVH